MELPEQPKLSKKEVHYGESSDPLHHRCGICEFHLHVPGTCKLECGLVEGEIHDEDGCDLFSIDLIEAALYSDGKHHCS